MQVTGNEVYTAMMEATQASQASGSNAVGPSASATVDNEAVPGHSFLATLHCPQPATIARKRKVAINPPPRGKRRSAARGTFDPKSVTPSQRVREFPDEQLTVSAGKLFCQACREELSTKISVLKTHIKTKKHADSIKRGGAKEAR